MENIFKVIEDGIEKEYQIIALCKNNNNNYIIYKDDNNHYASRYEINDNKIKLNEIIDDNEWDFIDQELEKIYE